MKLQISILVIGIALSAGSVSAELHRSASVASLSQSTGTAIVASSSSFQQSVTTKSTSKKPITVRTTHKKLIATRSTLKQSVATPPKISITGIRPSIKGGVSGGDD